jgi:hypothetical protein
MLTPDERFAREIVDALDLRCLPQLRHHISRQGRDERWWLEQQYGILDAVVAWLERWESNPRTGTLRAKEDPLREAVALVHDHLASSKSLLTERMADIDEAVAQALQDMSQV